MSSRDAAEERTITSGSRGGRSWLIAVLVALAVGTFVLLFVAMFATFVDVADEPPLVLLLMQMLSGTLAIGLSGAVGLATAQTPLDEGSSSQPVRFRVLVGITAALAAVHVVAAVIAGAPVLLVIAFTSGVAGLATTSWILGHRARLAAHERELRHVPPGEASSPDLGWTPAMIQSKVRKVVVTSIVALAASTVIAVVLAGIGEAGLASTWPFIVQLPMLAAGMACIIVVMPAQTAATPIMRGLDKAQRKAMSRRMLGKGEPLDPDLEWRAARYAAVTRVSQPFLVAQSLLILVGVVVPSIANGYFEGWFLMLYVILGVGLLAVTPWAVRQQVRMRRFANATRELARSGGPGEPVGRGDERIGEGPGA